MRFNPKKLEDALYKFTPPPVEASYKPKPDKQRFKIDLSDKKHSPFSIATLNIDTNKFPNLKKEIRILQLSDLHFGLSTSKKHLLNAVEVSNSLSPDLIVLTGDYLQYSSTDYHLFLGIKFQNKLFRSADYRKKIRGLAQNLSEIVSKLSSKYGIVGVFGNHDYIEGVGCIRRKLPSSIKWLLNSSTKINLDSIALNISGIDDFRYGEPNIKKAMQSFIQESTPSEIPEFKLTITHNPDIVTLPNNELLATADLILAGHTHGGQIRIPFYGAPITRTKQKKHFDRLSWFENTPFYVSHGVGYGTIGLRLFCPPEITLIRILG